MATITRVNSMFLVTAIAVAVIAVLFSGSSRTLFGEALSGNLAFVRCWKAFQAPASGPMSACSSDDGSPAQQATLALLQTVNRWRSQEYGALAGLCHDELCPCAIGQSAESASLDQRLTSVYVVLSYRIEMGRFPELESCRQNFVSSSFVWRESLELSARELRDAAGFAQELAYIIDDGWDDPWQRGLVAAKQADVYNGSGSTTLAQAAHSRAVESFGESGVEGADGYIASSLGALAQIALDEGKLEDAEETYRRAILTSPQAASSSFKGLIDLWRRQGHTFEYIVDQFTEMRLQGSAADPFSTSRPAVALLNSGATDAAVSMLDSAPADVRNAPSVLGTHGLVAEQAGDSMGAKDAYTKALQAARGGDPLEAAAWAAKLAEAEEALNDLPAALEHRQLTVELNPRSAGYWYNLARLYQKLGQREEAHTAILRAIQRDPQDERFRKLLAEVAPNG